MKIPSAVTHWVESTLKTISREQAVGLLLCPENRKYSIRQWREILAKVPLGAVFLDRDAPVAEIKAAATRPLLIAGDLEHGAGPFIPTAVEFPWLMAAGAADDIELTSAMARAAAREGLAAGFNWTFSPVVDLQINPANPVTNIRSFGSSPALVARHSAAYIRAIQTEGMAATAKHFPGDGIDDRDQHLCTSLNTLPMPEWQRSYGRVWRAAIRSGVMSIMSGHIALPDYQGCSRRPARALPATLSHRLQIDLLRRELGFEGVIVSDAAPMIGIASRVSAEDMAVENIIAGSDVFLFADPIEDYGRLLAAARSGRLTEPRIRDAARRVLTLQALLGLHLKHRAPRPVSPAAKRRYEADSDRLAERSITLVRENDFTPLRLKPGARVRTITVRYPEGDLRFGSELPVIDAELRARGFEVEHITNGSHRAYLRDLEKVDAVFVNFSICPHSRIGTMRLTGAPAMTLWRGFWKNCPQAIFTSFGSPYHLDESPHLPNFWCAYGGAPASQRAAVRAWLGEIPVRGRLPVSLPERCLL